MDHLIIACPGQSSEPASRLTWDGYDQALRLALVLRRQFRLNQIGRILTCSTPGGIAMANVLAAGLSGVPPKKQKRIEERLELGASDKINYHRFMFLLRGLYILDRKVAVVVADRHYVDQAPVDFLKMVVGSPKPKPAGGQSFRALLPGEAWHIYCKEGLYHRIPWWSSSLLCADAPHVGPMASGGEFFFIPPLL